MILSKPLTLENQNTIKLAIDNKVEITMMESIEQQILDYLRTKLKNTSLKIEYVVSENKTERKPYTNAEIFENMLKKNPALQKLRDVLGLDTDY